MSLISSVSGTMNEIATKMIWGGEVMYKREIVSPADMTDASFGHKILRTIAVALIIGIAAQILFAVPEVAIVLAVTASVTWFAGELSRRAIVPDVHEALSNGQQFIAGALNGIAQIGNRIDRAVNGGQARQPQAAEIQANEALNNDFATLLGRALKHVMYGSEEDRAALRQQQEAQRQRQNG